MRRTNFWTGLAGVIVGAVLVTALPAIAQDAEPDAVPGSNFKLGQINVVNADTSLRGDAATNLVVRNTGTGVPLSLLTKGNGKPPMKVDSRRLVRNLNADRLDFKDASDFLLADQYDPDGNLSVENADRVDGYHANELIRASFGSTLDADDANGEATSAGFIVAPKPGFLIMSGSIDGATNDPDLFECQLTVDGTVVPGTERRVLAGESGPSENCSTTGGFAVDAGTYTVALNITNSFNSSFGQASVWVIWVPFNGLGEIPVILDNPIADPTNEATITEVDEVPIDGNVPIP